MLLAGLQSRLSAFGPVHLTRRSSVRIMRTLPLIGLRRPIFLGASQALIRLEALSVKRYVYSQKPKMGPSQADFGIQYLTPALVNTWSAGRSICTSSLW